MYKSIEKLKKERGELGLKIDNLTERIHDDSCTYDEIGRICKKILSILRKRKVLDKKIYSQGKEV